MTENLTYLDNQLATILASFDEQAQMTKGDVFVVGCSTSEVIGAEIGTSGTMEIAELIFNGLTQFYKQHDIQLAFQCCEHLNRAIVMEREVAQRHNYEIVTVIPVRSAGGALGTFAYHHMKDPVIVEHIKADGGIDIGDTFIGMHLKHVAVPVRASIRELGHAHVTLATTRPKLIGGARAVYNE